MRARAVVVEGGRRQRSSVVRPSHSRHFLRASTGWEQAELKKRAGPPINGNAVCGLDYGTGTIGTSRAREGLTVFFSALAGNDNKSGDSGGVMVDWTRREEIAKYIKNNLLEEGVLDSLNLDRASVLAANIFGIEDEDWYQLVKRASAEFETAKYLGLYQKSKTPPQPNSANTVGKKKSTSNNKKDPGVRVCPFHCSLKTAA